MEIVPAVARSSFSDASLLTATQAERHGWTLAQLSSNSWGTIRSLSPASAVDHRASEHIALFEGVAAVRGELIEGPTHGLSMTLRGRHDIAASTEHHGVYTAVFADAEGVTISTDPVGHGQIYYTKLGSGLLICNRFHLLLMAMRSLAPDSTTIDPIAVARPFVYETPLFPGTYIREVESLAFGSTLRFDTAGYQERKRIDLVAESETLGPKDYAGLIDQACSDIRHNVMTCLGRAAPHHALSLTGGLDSRLVLAALISLGRHHDLSYYTYGAFSSPDREIAGGLRRLFCLSELQAAPNAEPSADEQLARLYSQNCGMRAMDLSSEGSSSDVLMMIGGCGENYRGFYSKMMLAKGTSNDDLVSLTDDEFFLSFIRSHGRWPNLGRAARAVMEGRMRAEIEDTGLERTTALDSLYIKYRNRYHFGLGTRIQSQTMLKFSPLDSVAAIRASLAIDPAARMHGKVALDILLRLYPPLAFLPSTSEGWAPEAAAGRLYADALKAARYPMPAATVSEGARTVVPRQTSDAPQRRIEFEDVLAKRANELLERMMDNSYLKPLVRFERLADLMTTEAAAGNGRKFIRYVLASVGNTEQLLRVAGAA